MVTSDRWSTYRACARRQLCWAHLVRNLEGLALRGAEAAAFARRAVAACERLFAAWQAFKSGEFDREALKRRIAPLRARLGRLLARGAEPADRKLVAFCRDLKAQWIALWTFVTEVGVEPTNNAAERALRRAVLGRKCCYLTRAIVARRQNRAAPRLLPTG